MTSDPDARAQTAAVSRPNVVIVMADQHQARCCAREGYPLDTTPFLDSLARTGVWFNKAYTASPECVPARVSLLTGRYPGAHGIRTNPSIRSGPRYETDLVDVLKKLGYATAVVGKNHSHLTPQRVDHWFHFSHGGGRVDYQSEQEKAFDKWLNDLRHGVSEAPTPFPLECQGPARIVHNAQQWVGELPDDQPFFLWMSFPEPHNPYQVPEPYFSMFPIASHPPVYGSRKDAEAKGFQWQFLSRMERKAMPRYDELLPRMRADYYGMLRLIDDQVKRFVDFLGQQGRREHTIMICLADHGDYAGDYDLMRKGAGLPEDLTRIPFLINGPGIPAQPSAHPAHISIVDVMPTLCEALGVPLPAGVQGRSLWPMLTGKSYPRQEFTCAYAEQGFGGLFYSWDDDIDYTKCIKPALHFDELNQYSQCGIMRMVRKDDWKLIYDMEGRGALYNLREDPGELQNLYNESAHAAVRYSLLEELLTRTLRAQDPLPPPGGDYERKNHPRNYWTLSNG